MTEYKNEEVLKDIKWLRAKVSSNEMQIDFLKKQVEVVEIKITTLLVIISAVGIAIIILGIAISMK